MAKLSSRYQAGLCLILKAATVFAIAVTTNPFGDPFATGGDSVQRFGGKKRSLAAMVVVVDGWLPIAILLDVLLNPHMPVELLLPFTEMELTKEFGYQGLDFKVDRIPSFWL